MSEMSPSNAIDNLNADEAYARVLPRAMELRPDSVLGINLDVMSSVFTAMSVLERLPPFVDEMRKLPNFAMETVENLRDYVLAMYTAQLRYTFAATPEEDIPSLLEEATKWRDILSADAKALVARGQLQADLLKELIGVHGYRNVAVDLSGLTTILKGGWSQFEGQIGLKKEELAEADRVALRLAAAAAHRQNSPERVAEVTDIRQRVFTLFYLAYDQVRRAISYLRWDAGDANEIIPSLYAGRPNTNIAKKNADEASVDGVNRTKAEPEGGEAASKPVGAPKPSDVNNVAPAAAAKAPVGFPGGEPLASA